MTFFFFNDAATTEIYPLSLHDALPIFVVRLPIVRDPARLCRIKRAYLARHYRGVERIPFAHQTEPARFLGEAMARTGRSEEHTSELQSRSDLVCRLLLEKKKQILFRLQ